MQEGWRGILKGLVGGRGAVGGVFEFPIWQHEGEELATPQSSYCLLFTRTVDGKQWHTHTSGTLRRRPEVNSIFSAQTHYSALTNLLEIC